MEPNVGKKLADRIRRRAATFLACSVVVLVPLLSLIQFGHTGHIKLFTDRKASALPSFQVRPADTDRQPVRLFMEPLISVTFDDGWETTYNDALPLLQQYGILSTQYLLSGTANNSQYLSWSQITAMHEAGHEIACHSVSHPDLRLVDDQKLDYELKGCLEVMNDRFGEVRDFASPYGSSDPHTIAAIKHYFKSHRNTNGDPSNGVNNADVNTPQGYNGQGFDRYNIIGVTIKSDTTVDEIQALIDYARSHNGWVVLTYHQAEAGGSRWAVDTKSMAAQLATISKSNVRVVTVSQALENWR